MRRLLTLVFSCAALLLSVLAVSSAQAEITHPVKADISYSFIVGNATLPPEQYIFRIMPKTDLDVMTAINKDGSAGVEFLVRMTIAQEVPQESELVFNGYGNREFLHEIFEQGSKIGVVVVEPSREESRLLRQNQTPVEHTEEEPQ